MKKSAAKSNPLLEIMKRKKEALKTSATSKSFGQFKFKKSRNENNSNVGPSWGGRKGN